MARLDQGNALMCLLMIDNPPSDRNAGDATWIDRSLDRACGFCAVAEGGLYTLGKLNLSRAVCLPTDGFRDKPTHRISASFYPQLLQP